MELLNSGERRLLSNQIGSSRPNPDGSGANLIAGKRPVAGRGKLKGDKWNSRPIEREVPMKSRTVEIVGTKVECRASSIQSHAGLRVCITFFDHSGAIGNLIRICRDPCAEHGSLACLDDEAREAEALLTLTVADISQSIESCKAIQRAGNGVDYPCTLLRSWHYTLPSCRIGRAPASELDAST